MVDVDIDFRTQRVTGVRSYNVEREITRAIQRVTQGAIATVYYVTGSGEKPLSPEFITFLESENIAMREINLVREEIPDDADILFIPMPARDWTEKKAERVSQFLIGEGRAFFALDLSQAMPNFFDVLGAYGRALNSNIIFEDDDRSVFMGRSFYIIPHAAAHEITENLQTRQFLNLVPFFPVELSVLDVRKTTIEIEPLWTTSQNSFARNINSEAETMARVPEDISGPFNLALAVTDRIFIDGEEFYTRLVAVNSFDFMDSWYNAYIGEGNWQFVLNSLRWLKDQPVGVSVPARMPPGQTPLRITGFTASMISVTAIGVIPLTIIAAGLFVWLKRRNA
jgi:hypothetical protein